MMYLIGKAAINTLCLLALLSSYAAYPRVETKYGPILGKILNVRGATVQAYLGIPYATPPLGELRFQRPMSVNSWQKPLHAFNISPPCFMYTEEPFLYKTVLPPMTEDCLYLNIWVPGDCDGDELKAVMFFIHGGYFSVGSGAQPLYDGSFLATVGDVIVVTTNYRLGPIGFAYSATDSAPGNAGFYDVIEALKWTNENIAAFGGDDQRITVFGESAGAMMITLMAVSPITRGLYARAILQSDVLTALHHSDGNNNLMRTQTIAKKVGCTSGVKEICIDPDNIIDCLREIDALTLCKVDYFVKPTSRAQFVPQFDNELLPEDPFLATLKGDFMDSEIMIGITKDEMSYFLPIYHPELFGDYGYKDTKIGKEIAKRIIKDLATDFKVKGNITEVFDYYIRPYSDDDYDGIRNQLAIAISDLLVTCPSVYIAEEYARKGNSAYFFVFSHRTKNSFRAPWLGVVHFEEIPFVFGAPFMKEFGSMYSAVERQFSINIMTAWANFAKWGKPSIGTEYWPLYTEDTRLYFNLDINSYGELLPGPSTAGCNLFRKVYSFGTTNQFCGI